MRKGKVIVIAISHKNLNKVFKEGEIVSENAVENFDLLIKQGKIEEIKNKEPEKEKDQKAKEPVKKKEPKPTK